jgi:hypothetical protein
MITLKYIHHTHNTVNYYINNILLNQLIGTNNQSKIGDTLFVKFGPIKSSSGH